MSDDLNFRKFVSERFFIFSVTVDKIQIFTRGSIFDAFVVLFRFKWDWDKQVQQAGKFLVIINFIK